MHKGSKYANQKPTLASSTVVNALNCHCWVDDYALTGVKNPNALFSTSVLLCYEWGDVGFDTASASVQMSA